MNDSTKWFVRTLLFIYIANAIGKSSENGLSITHRRFRRQLDSQRCSGGQFFCKSGECIPTSQECDGAVHCKDGSDESTNCRRLKCPKYLFSCDYGACISKNLECDDKEDCRDGSDENTPNCSNTTIIACANNEFRCNSGQCINSKLKCDGNFDCKDKSDETSATCWNFKCPRYLYRCGYGACVDGNAECNGVIECSDGSDEDNSKCHQEEVTTLTTPTKPTVAPIVTQRPPSGGCIVPNYPEHGQLINLHNSKVEYQPGQFIPYNSVLRIVCKSSYKLLKGNNVIACDASGQWSDSVGACTRVCPAIASTQILSAECSFNSIPQSCDAATEGTLVRYKCANFYENINRKSIDICKDGTWDNTKPSCIPECGRKKPSATPLSVNGKNVTRGEFPWQAALYRISDKQLICGGSLISQSLIVTAAHCVTIERGEPSSIRNFEVAVGKYYRSRDDTRDRNEAQFSTLQKIIVSPKYKGETQNYLGDIAILVTSKKFELSLRVQPVCLDLGQNYEADLYNPQKTDKGFVTGWGYTRETGKPSEVLKQLEVPPVSIDTCTQNIPQNFEIYLTDDKMCAGYYDQSTSVCSGDSGGGLVFKFDGRFYLTGIVSLSPTAPTTEGGCDSQHVGLYTRIYSYIPFIFSATKKYD